MTITEVTLLILFVSITGFGFLYIKYLISQIQQRSTDIFIIKELLGPYSKNLKEVYESEMYYGEPVLQNLVEHSKFLDLEIQKIITDYDFSTYPMTEIEETGEVEE